MGDLVKMEYGCIQTNVDSLREIFQRKVEKNVENLWFLCTMWDDKALKEMEAHREYGNLVHTKMFLGRMLQIRIMEKGPDHFGMTSQMDWTKSFVLVDIVDNKFETCGTKKCLRVHETRTSTNVHGDSSRRPKIWDLVIFPECAAVAEEMIRLQPLGVKTTVAIWNADDDRYPEPWIDDGDEVLGEIFLRPTGENEKILTIAILHQETVANATIPVGTTSSKEEGVFRSYSNFSEGKNAGDGDHLAYFIQKTYQRIQEFPEFLENSERENTIACAQKRDTEDYNGSESQDDGEVVWETAPSSPVPSSASMNVLEELNAQLFKIAKKMIDLGTTNFILSR